MSLLNVQSRQHGNSVMDGTSNKHLCTCKFMLQCALNSRRYTFRLSLPDFRFLCLLYIGPLIFRCKIVNGHFYKPHTNFFLTALILFELIDVPFCNELMRVFGQSHVTDNVIALNLIWVIFYGKCYFHVVLHPPCFHIDKVIWHLRFFRYKGFCGKVLLMIYNIEGKITECWLVETEGIFS